MTIYQIGLLLVPFMIIVNVLLKNWSLFSWACIGLVLLSSILGLVVL